MDNGGEGHLQDVQSLNATTPHLSIAQASELSSLYLRRWSAFHHEEDLAEAMSFARQVVDSCVPNGREHGLALLRLAEVQYVSLRHSGTVPMISEAVANFKTGMKLLPETAPERIEYGKAFLQALKLKLMTSLDDLDEAISIAKLIVSHSLKSAKNGDIWYDLLTFYTKKLEITNGSPASLVDAAIMAGEACLEDRNMASDFHRSCHFNLSNLYFRRFRTTSNALDINRAVDHGELSLRDAPPDDPNLARWHLVLSRAHATRFSTKRIEQDLEDATRYAEQAVSYYEKGYTKGVDGATVLNNLSNRFDDRYAAKGDQKDLKQAINLARGVLKLAQSARDKRVFEQNLVSLLSSSFSEFGNQDDLEEAIRIGYETVNRTGQTDPDRAAYLTVIASSLIYRYSVKNALDDVREAIRLMREAIHLTNPSHISYNVMRSNLSKHLKLLYSRTKEADVMKEVLAIQEECVASSSPDDSDRPMFLDHLANTCDDLFLETGDITYSGRALELGASAMAARGPSDPARGSSYTNQSARFWSRYKKIQETTAIDRAIKYARLSVRSYEGTHPNKALACNNLGNMLNERYNLQGDAQDRAEAKRTYLDAFQQENALTTIRIEAGRAVGILYGEDQAWQDSWKVLEQSVRMFPRLSPRSVSRGDQQDSLSHLSGISCLACSAAIMAGLKPEACLEILETGRGIISGLAMFLDEDISRLKQEHPGMYEEFQQKRRDISVSPASGVSSLETSRSQNEEFDRLLERIRTLHGFSCFLLAPHFDEVQSLCKRGPIICVNVTELGSHAILVTQSDIRLLPLKQLSYERLEQEAATFLCVSKVESKTYEATNAILRGLATWLWEVAIGPVLSILGFLPSKPPTGGLPRVYWMPCGLLSQMPIHASGIYKPRSGERAENYVVSSYITTLKSAVRNRNAASKQLLSPWAQPLIVSMPKTPGMIPLLAEEEAAAIQNILDTRLTSTNADASPAHRALVLTNRSKVEVKAELCSCTLAHFVCHGRSSNVDPSSSALYVGPADAAEPEALTMAELAAMGMQIGKAKLAFLSACSTAENASGQLLDEVIHMASGFQLLGFSHVVATLWPTSNAAAVLVAERFYSSLLRDEFTSESGDSDRENDMAHALRDAVKEVRLRGIPGESKPKWPPSDILAWAPFVHFGL